MRNTAYEPSDNLPDGRGRCSSGAASCARASQELLSEERVRSGGQQGAGTANVEKLVKSAKLSRSWLRGNFQRAQTLGLARGADKKRAGPNARSESVFRHLSYSSAAAKLRGDGQRLGQQPGRRRVAEMHLHSPFQPLEYAHEAGVDRGVSAEKFGIEQGAVSFSDTSID